MSAKGKVKIAHLAGPKATIQNSPPLVTSNKARRKYGLPPRATRMARSRARRPAGATAGRAGEDLCRMLFCASARADAAELYGPPDGYLDAEGVFQKERRAAADKPVFEVEMKPEDGLYPLPYMARQTDGQAWEEECASPAPAELARPGFFPDGSRSFEEVDRLSMRRRHGELISSFATSTFIGYCRPVATPRAFRPQPHRHGRR